MESFNWDQFREDLLIGAPLETLPVDRMVVNRKPIEGFYGGPLTHAHKLTVPDSAKLVGVDTSELTLSCTNTAHGRIVGAQIRLDNPRETSFFITGNVDAKEALEWIEPHIKVHFAEPGFTTSPLEITNPIGWTISTLHEAVLRYLFVVSKVTYGRAGFFPNNIDRYNYLTYLRQDEWVQVVEHK